MRQLAAARPDLKLLLMSATVDTQKLIDYFQDTAAGELLRWAQK
jgi:HrpA-like RNA helicase